MDTDALVARFEGLRSRPSVEDGLSHRQSEFMHSAGERWSADAISFCDLSQTQQFAVNVIERDSRLINSLHAIARPPAVARFIIAVVVDAVECVFRRARTHISKERIERIAPSFTHSNAPPTISAKVRRGWIAATGFHPMPCLIFTRRTASWLVPVFCHPLRCEYLAKTTAASLRTAKQFLTQHKTPSAAITNTSPSAFCRTWVHAVCAWAFNKVSTETLTSEIDIAHGC